MFRLLLIIITIFSLSACKKKNCGDDFSNSSSEKPSPEIVTQDTKSQPQVEHPINKDNQEEIPYKHLGNDKFVLAIIAVDEYFQSINSGNCKRAIEIRPKYKLRSCKEVQSVDQERSLVKHGKTTAVVYVSVTIKHKNKATEEKLQGHFLLKKQNKEWLIQEPFVPITKMDEETFLKKYFKEDEAAPELLESRNNTNQQEDNDHQKLSEIESQAKIDKGEEIDTTTESIVTDLPERTIDLQGYKTFGSKAVLAKWTDEELYGNPSKDKKVKRPIPADHEPPAYKVPKNTGLPLPARLRNSIRYVPNPNKKIVALTFDLCERAKERTGYDGGIINYLRKNKVKATFYAGGKWMRSHPEKTQQLMADPLFEIGNHGWTHGNMRVLTGEKMKNQILWTQAQYEILRSDLQRRFSVPEEQMRLIPPVPLTFRFPYGTCSAESLNTLASYGLPAVQWNIVTADPARGQTGKAISQIIKRQIKPGSIIIAHANGRGHGTEDSLHRFIPQLRKEGYEFVTVSELLASSNKVKATEQCYEVTPNDNKRYDRIFGEGTE